VKAACVAPEPCRKFFGSRLSVISINIIKVILRRGKCAGGMAVGHLINGRSGNRSKPCARDVKPLERRRAARD
jgi:hypothetical protein